MTEPQAVPLDLDTADRLARGELRLVQFQRSYSYRLSQADWVIYEAAKRAGYIVLPRAEHRYRRLEHIWGTWCEVRDWPMCCIKPRVKYALIDSDQIMLPAKSLPSHAQLTPIAHLFDEHACGGWHSVSPTYIAISRVPIGIAPLIASRIVTVLWEALGLPALPQVEVQR